MLNKIRCEWVTNGSLIDYHDKEWGVPIRNDTKIFEFLLLDGAQAGLSWLTILRKREFYRNAFDNFNPIKISSYTSKDVSRLLKYDGIIRNKTKIKSAINNAKKFLHIQKEFGTFSHYIWNFVNYEPIVNNFKKWKNVPTLSLTSEMISKDLKNRGFTFVGPTICYAFMQSIGLVNDHIVPCFRRDEIRRFYH